MCMYAYQYQYQFTEQGEAQTCHIITYSKSVIYLIYQYQCNAMINERGNCVFICTSTSTSTVHRTRRGTDQSHYYIFQVRHISDIPVPMQCNDKRERQLCIYMYQYQYQYQYSSQNKERYRPVPDAQSMRCELCKVLLGPREARLQLSHIAINVIKSGNVAFKASPKYGGNFP